MDVRFRPVGPADHPPTRELVDEAFGTEDVVTYLDALRADGCILGEWLAEDASGLVGHIVFSRVWVERPNGERVDAAMLTPMAVRPDRQRTGIGMRLTMYGLEALEARGESLFFVVGHPEYYPRSGFSADDAARVSSPWAGNPAFMVRGRSVPEGKLVMPAPIAAEAD